MEKRLNVNEHMDHALKKGLSDFLRQTYTFTGAGIAGSLGIATILSNLSNVESAMFPLFIGGFACAIGGGIGISTSKYTIHEKRFVNHSKNDHLNNGLIPSYCYSTNSRSRLLSFGALSVGMGMTLAPLVAIVPAYVLPASFVITSSIFAGSSAYAYWRPQGSILKYQAPLFGGLIGLVGMQIIGLGALAIAGPNILTEMIHSADVYGGIVLFTALTAVETQVAVKMYESKNPDHLGCATNLYLDFMNILIRITEAMAKAKANKK
jgi:FtsH-binding integral membrane protein